MAKHQISKTLERAYRSTTFEVDHPDGPLVIRIGETSEQLDALLRQHKARRWAYVTACNPRSAQISSVVNSQRHSELKAYLLSMGFTIYPGRGVPAEPGWEPEDSFLVLDITREQAVRVGVMLEQNAIVLGEAGKPASLVFCELPEASKERYADEVTADIRCYIDEHIEELWENAWVLGIWVRESDVPDKVNAEDLDILEGKIPSRRRAALEAGKEPTPRELRLWREA